MDHNIQSVIHGYDRQKEEEETRLIAEENDLPYINLVNFPLTGDILGIIPEETARKYNVIAFQQLGNTVRVATHTPHINGLAEAMNKIGEDRDVVFAPHFCSKSSIEYALHQYPILVKKNVNKT